MSKSTFYLSKVRYRTKILFVEEVTQPYFATSILGNEQEITWVSSNNFSCVVSCAHPVGKGLESLMMRLRDCVANYYDGIVG